MNNQSYEINKVTVGKVCSIGNRIYTTDQIWWIMPPDFTCLIILEIYSTNPISLSKRKGQSLLHKCAW
jgi:hypothetical protein